MLQFSLVFPAEVRQSTLHIYHHLLVFTIYVCITNSQIDQRSVGLKADFVEHCTGVTEVKGSNPVQVYMFLMYITAKISCVFKSFRIVKQAAGFLKKYHAKV